MFLISRLTVIDCASFWYVPTHTTTRRHLTNNFSMSLQHLPTQIFDPSWCNPGPDPDPARATLPLCAVVFDLVFIVWSRRRFYLSFTSVLLHFCMVISIFKAIIDSHFFDLLVILALLSLRMIVFYNVITCSFHQRVREPLSCHCKSVPLVFISISTFYRGGEL